jgi:hypothetical protein
MKLKELPMSKKIPNIIERALVKTWPKSKCIKELRANAIDGNVEWVKLLLSETDYESYPLMLKRDWWSGDASPEKEEFEQRTRTGVRMMRKLLDTIAIDELPKNIAEQIPTSVTDKNIVILKLWPQAGRNPIRKKQSP